MAAGTGVPCDASTTYGTVADKLQFDRVQSYIESGKSEAKLVLGGNRMGDEVSLTFYFDLLIPASDPSTNFPDIYRATLSIRLSLRILPQTQRFTRKKSLAQCR